MIVICGALPTQRGHPGLAQTIATAAARGGGAVQVVGIVPDGVAGDRLIHELAQAGVGHAAVLRALDRPMEPADVALALRYLPDIRVVIAAELDAGLSRAVADGAAFAGSILVVVRPAADAAPEGPQDPGEVTVLVAPAADPDGTFAGFVAAFAIRLDSGAVPADAWAATLETLAVDAVR